MATKAALVNPGDEPRPKKPSPVKAVPVKQLRAKRQEPNAGVRFMESAVTQWKDFTGFLSDVRGEMRKVVTPSRKEVESTTTVVILAVFFFGVYFFVVDAIFHYGLDQLLTRLGGVGN